MKKLILGIICIMMFIVSPVMGDVINVQTVIDYSSELVVTPNGLYWHNISGAKPGNFGNNYETAGPTYFNDIAWIPTWTTDPALRNNDTSNLFLIDMAGFSGFEVSTRYGGYFDNYPSNYGLNTLYINLNRDTISSGSYAGYPTIRIDDPTGGQQAYSFDLVVPEPATVCLLIVGSFALFKRRQFFPR